MSHTARLVAIPMYTSSIYFKISYLSIEHAEALEIQMIIISPSPPIVSPPYRGGGV
jgi:hypothetical protein